MYNTFTADEISKIKNVKNTLVNSLNIRLSQFPDRLKSLLKDQSILTGGAFASVFWNLVPNDYDLYLSQPVDIDVLNELLKRDEVLAFVKDVNPSYSANILVNGKLVTTNAVTFNNDIQVITCLTAKHREHFDYVHCMPFLNIAEGKFYISKEQYSSVANKILKINPNAKRVDGHRTTKFIERGWKP